jgi:RNA polymerase sigma-70 factor (ECF subfamily)
MSEGALRRDDRDLAARCARGERHAQEAFFNAQKRRVHCILYRILGGNREIEDVAQEAFVAIFRALPSYRGEASLATFVDRITTRVALKNLRTEPARVALTVVVSQAPAADARAEAREGARRLYAILARLPPKQHVAFSLHVIDGRSVREVAGLMEATEVATRVRVFRARRAVESAAARDPVLASLLGLREQEDGA